MEEELRTIMEYSQGPAFELDGGRVVYANREAEALGLAAGLKPDLPQILSGACGAQPVELTLPLKGRIWGLRALPRGGSLYCFLRPEGVVLPSLNEAGLLRLGGNLRSSVQELMTFFNSLADLPALERGPLAEQAASGLRSVFRLTRAALRLELFSQLRSGQRPLRQTRCEPRALTEAFCREVEDLLQAAGLRLEVQLPRQDYPGAMDWGLVSTLLWELLANAAANSRDGIIRFSLTREGSDKLHYAVTNRPLDPALPEALFQRHAQDPETPGEGMGLGLSLVTLGAQRHGGSFLLSGGASSVTALLTLNVSAPVDGTLRYPVEVPASDLPSGLLYLSQVLPASEYRLEGVF